jgi:hypothetical protein
VHPISENPRDWSGEMRRYSGQMERWSIILRVLARCGKLTFAVFFFEMISPDLPLTL